VPGSCRGRGQTPPWLLLGSRRSQCMLYTMSNASCHTGSRSFWKLHAMSQVVSASYSWPRLVLMLSRSPCSVVPATAEVSTCPCASKREWSPVSSGAWQLRFQASRLRERQQLGAGWAVPQEVSELGRCLEVSGGVRPAPPENGSIIFKARRASANFEQNSNATRKSKTSNASHCRMISWGNAWLTFRVPLGVPQCLASIDVTCAAVCFSPS
jgi:hypothetical protein